MFLSSESTFVIAEAGVNHNGDPALAVELIEAAAESGVDAVKFQTFDTKSLVTNSAPKAEYQKLSGNQHETQYDMLLSLELGHDTFIELKQVAEDNGLVFLSTAFDSLSLSFLVDVLELKILKIPSGEITNGPLLLEYAYSGRDIILSTGMATFAEVRSALSIMAFGFMNYEHPSANSFAAAFNSSDCRDLLRERLVLLHCTTNYPAPNSSVNLKAMETMGELFDIEIGYSDHTTGWLASCMAVALGARVIEKHFTMDKSLPGPDHSASLQPNELKQMVDEIRTLEVMMGSGEKKPHETESLNRDVVRKSIVASNVIEKGEEFTKENLRIKRPGNGRSPMEYWELLGTVSNRKYFPDDQIL